MCFVALAGCAPRAKAPSGGTRNLESARSGDLLALLASRRQAIQAIRGTAKLRVTVDSQNPEEQPQQLSTSQAVLVRAPASFRLESLSPFGVSYAVASDGRQLAVLVAGEGVLYRGDASARTIGAATGVLAEAREVTSLLLGLPPVPPLDEAAAWVSTEPPGPVSHDAGPAPVVYLHAPSRLVTGETIVVGFGSAVTGGGASESVPVLFERIGRDGALHLRARFSGFRRVDGATVATVVVVEAPGSAAELRYRDVALAPTVAGDSFVLATPEGVREEPLGGLTQTSGS